MNFLHSAGRRGFKISRLPTWQSS